MKFTKITALLAAAVMTAGAATSMSVSAKSYFVKVMKGDINGNGRFDADDISQLDLHIKGEKALGKRYTTGDVNWDGRVDVTDLAELVKKVYHSGDVNDNGILDSDDAQKILDHVKGKKALKGAALLTADISGDGRIDVVDVVQVNNLRGKSAGFKAGNVLDDNYITSDDTNAILDHIKGKAALSSEELIRADVNNDGRVDIVDYSKIFNYISK